MEEDKSAKKPEWKGIILSAILLIYIIVEIIRNGDYVGGALFVGLFIAFGIAALALWIADAFMPNAVKHFVFFQHGDHGESDKFSGKVRPGAAFLIIAIATVILISVIYCGLLLKT